MSTHNICFRREIRKNIMWIPPLICSYASTAKLIFIFAFVEPQQATPFACASTLTLNVAMQIVADNILIVFSVKIRLVILCALFA